jgi:hypothetical protein
VTVVTRPEPDWLVPVGPVSVKVPVRNVLGDNHRASSTRRRAAYASNANIIHQPAMGCSPFKGQIVPNYLNRLPDVGCQIRPFPIPNRSETSPLKSTTKGNCRIDGWDQC